MRSERFFDSVLGLFFIGLAGGGLLVTQGLQSENLWQARKEMQKTELAIPEWERESRFSPKLFQVLSFGQLPVAIDLLWLRSLQDTTISTHATWKEGEHPLVYYSLDMATELDPLFFEAYVAGASFLSIVRNDAAGARDLLERGSRFEKTVLNDYPKWFREKNWESAWNIPFILSYLYMFPLSDLPRAAQAIREVAASKNAPEYYRGLERKLEKPDGIYEIGHVIMTGLIKREKDPTVRSELESKRSSLFVLHFLFKANRSFREFAQKPATGRELASFDAPALQKAWREFVARRGHELGIQVSGQGAFDPFGGELRVDEKGRVRTTTPYESVYGLTGE